MRKNETSVALGSFDGLHAGHQSVLQSALSFHKDGLLPLCLLFDEHPQAVLRGSPPPLLMLPGERDARLRAMGFSLRTVSFREICDMEPEMFVRAVLCDSLRAAVVSCGYNYRFGRGGAGDADCLRRLCERAGIQVCVCPPVEIGGEPVSSTRIRALLESGACAEAAELLTRPFSFTETVVHGAENGRLYGYPTINQPLPAGLVAPRFGVYVSQTLVDGVWYDSLTNIGVRPTLPGGTPVCETHILGVDRTLYGRQITVSLTRYLRAEKKFASLADVFRQVRADLDAAGLAKTENKIL